MSKDDRASVSELEAEFNRAMALLTDDMLPSDAPEHLLTEIEGELYAAYDLIGNDDDNDAHDETFADHLTSIAAIALEGAARLRRTK